MPLLDRCIFLATTGTTADFTEASAVTGYQTMEAAQAADNGSYSYAAQSSDLSQWEVGTGTYHLATTSLSRTTVLFNSLGTTAHINFSVAPQVLLTILAEDITNLTPSGPFEALLYNNSGIIACDAVSTTDANGNLTLTTINALPLSQPATDTTGTSIAIGTAALAGSETGANLNNIAIGVNVMASGAMTATAKNNVAIGPGALQFLTSGEGNFGLGSGALHVNTSGDENVAIGNQALGANIGGLGNVAIGATALEGNVSGQGNVAIGQSAMRNSLSTANTGVGGGSVLDGLTGGLANTAIGYHCCAGGIVNGNGNTWIGCNISPASDVSNTAAIAIGNAVIGLDYGYTNAGLWTFAGGIVPATVLTTTLSTANPAGAMINVSNSTVNTWGTSLSTSLTTGTFNVLARFNGANWTVVGA